MLEALLLFNSALFILIISIQFIYESVPSVYELNLCLQFMYINCVNHTDCTDCLYDWVCMIDWIIHTVNYKYSRLILAIKHFIQVHFIVSIWKTLGNPADCIELLILQQSLHLNKNITVDCCFHQVINFAAILYWTFIFW